MKKGQKSWVHHANKNRDTNSSTTKEEKIHDYLNETEYKTIMQKKIFSPDFQVKGSVRNPDFWTIADRGFNQFVMLGELDGEVHGFGDQVSETEQTKNRNDDFVRAGIPFVAINEEWCKTYGIDFGLAMHVGFHVMNQFARAVKRVGVFEIKECHQ